jgi:hypothetical protein
MVGFTLLSAVSRSYYFTNTICVDEVSRPPVPARPPSAVRGQGSARQGRQAQLSLSKGCAALRSSELAGANGGYKKYVR